MLFQIGDKIAHPMHGAGVVAGIESRRISGVDRDYYVLQLPVGGMQVMIPVESCQTIGVREIVDCAEADRILAAIPDIQVEETLNWNKRYRENMFKIKSGNLMDVAEVIKSLMLREADRGLSTGERKILHSAKQILISELALSKDTSYEAIELLLARAVEISGVCAD